MNALRDGDRPVPGCLASLVRKRMAGLNPLDARRQVWMRMSADGNRFPYREAAAIADAALPTAMTCSPREARTSAMSGSADARTSTRRGLTASTPARMT
jgi:hypothetical protein